MNGNKDSANSSNSVAVLALLALIPIFLVVISIGWHDILEPVISPSENPSINLAAWAAAIAIAIVAVVLAWGVASEHARLRTDKTARFTWLAYLFVLIVISALGTMNLMFMKFQVPTFLKEAAETTLAKLTELDQLALNDIKLLKSDELHAKQEEQERNLEIQRQQFANYLESAKQEASDRSESFKNQIISLFESFDAEVRNPLKAGCGEVAIGYLEKIQAKLPDLRLPSGDCSESNPDVMIKAYRAAIDKALANWANSNDVPCDVPEAWDVDISRVEAITGVDIPSGGNSCSELERTLRTVERSIETYISRMPLLAPGDEDLAQLKNDSLDALRDQITKVKALYLNTNLERDDASPVLKAAWSEYSTVYTKLATVIGPAEMAKLPPSIDDDRVDKVGSIGNTIEILLSRYDHLATYPIILAAVFFDMILVAFFFRVETSRSRKRQVGGHAERLRKIRSSLNEA